MSERRYEAAGAALLRSPGGQVLPRRSYGDLRTGDLYHRQATHVNSLHSHPLTRAGVAESLQYSPSMQRFSNPVSTPASYSSAELLRVQRANIAAAFDHQVSLGPRSGRSSRSEDILLNREIVLPQGGYMNGPRRINVSSYEEPDVSLPRRTPAQVAAFDNRGSVKHSREDLERYLLAVQPDKLLRNASSYLPPGPAIKRARYATMANSVAPPPEVDVYSNYRQAKLRRSMLEEKTRLERLANKSRALSGVTATASGSSRRERDRVGGRERRRRSYDRATVSGNKEDKPANEQRSGSLPVSKQNEGKLAEQPDNDSESSKGIVHSSDKQENGVSQPASVPETEKTGSKEENHEESDKDSELGSLCADLSDFEDEKDTPVNKSKKKSEEPEGVIDAPLDGMIFGCSSATFYECMRLQLFGLPNKNKDEVLRVAPGTKLFLFNFDTKELSGIFEAVSHGGMMLQPDAFTGFGSFPAQVQVCCVEQCPNVHLSDFKPLIKENFLSSFKFKFTLNGTQVRDLMKLFRKAKRLHQQRIEQRQRDGLLPRYLPDGILSGDYMLGSAPQRSQSYSQNLQASFGLSSISSGRVGRLQGRNKLRASRKVSKGRRKKRKVDKANKSSPSDLLETMGGADVAKSDSKPCENADVSNKILPLVIKEVNIADESKAFGQEKGIVELNEANFDSKRSHPPEHDIGGRNQEQGKRLSVLERALDKIEDVIQRSSERTFTASEVFDDLSLTSTLHSLVKLSTPPRKADVAVAGEGQSMDELDLSEVVTSGDLDMEDTPNLGAGCSAQMLNQDVSVSAVTTAEIFLEDEPVRRYLDVNLTGSIPSVPDVSCTLSTGQKRSDSGCDQGQDESTSLCNILSLGCVASRLQESTDLHKQDSAIATKIDKTGLNNVSFNTQCSDVESLSPRADDEEMVEIVYDDLQSEALCKQSVQRAIEKDDNVLSGKTTEKAADIVENGYRANAQDMCEDIDPTDHVANSAARCSEPQKLEGDMDVQSPGSFCHG